MPSGQVENDEKNWWITWTSDFARTVFAPFPPDTKTSHGQLVTSNLDFRFGKDDCPLPPTEMKAFPGQFGLLTWT